MRVGSHSRCRFAHSFSTYRLQGRDHDVRPSRKSCQIESAKLWLEMRLQRRRPIGQSLGNALPKSPRSQLCHGKVNVRFCCDRRFPAAADRPALRSIEPWDARGLLFSPAEATSKYSTSGRIEETARALPANDACSSRPYRAKEYSRRYERELKPGNSSKDIHRARFGRGIAKANSTKV